jgi:bacteriocin-like protein
LIIEILKEIMKMSKTVMNKEVKLTKEELNKVSGGYPGIGCPLFYPDRTSVPKFEPKEEPKDGGATGGW